MVSECEWVKGLIKHAVQEFNPSMLESSSRHFLAWSMIDTFDTLIIKNGFTHYLKESCW